MWTGGGGMLFPVDSVRFPYAVLLICSIFIYSVSVAVVVLIFNVC